MKYMGSKSRVAKEILPIMLKHRQQGQWWVEPFVGGANIIDKVDGNRIGADIDSDLICVLDAASRGWLPPSSMSEMAYKRLKNAPTTPIKGYAAFALSYGGKKFGGWRRDSIGKRNYCDEAYRNALDQFPRLIGVQFINVSYDKLCIPDKSIVYCDPPYRGTTAYKDGFDHDVFYSWCRGLVSAGHSVFVSEYWMPDDFICIWSKKIASSLTRNTGSKVGVEKLYTLKSYTDAKKEVEKDQ